MKTKLFCNYCHGSLTKGYHEGKERQVCGSCGEIYYENPLPAVSVMVTNQNKSIIPQGIVYGAITLPAPSPSDRPLLACANLSYYNNVSNRNNNIYTGIDGGWSKPHRSAHLNGNIPSGGNVGMLDGSGHWVKFPFMIPRTVSYPYFWW